MRGGLQTLLSVVFLSSASLAHAVSTFDLIVPTEIRLTLNDGSASGFTNNGGLWVVATAATLIADDFSDVSVGISVDDGRIAAIGGFLNEASWTPLLPGHAVGETTLDNDYLTLLTAAESLVTSNPFSWSIEFPSYSEVIGDHLVSWSIRVGDQHFAFESVLKLSLGSDFKLDFAGQRITSAPVPEPSALALFGLGLVCVAIARRRRLN